MSNRHAANRAGIAICGFVAAIFASQSAVVSGAEIPAVKPLVQLDGKSKNPFEGGVVVAEHAASGAKALRIDRGYAVWSGPQDWSGYDYLKADLYTDAERPQSLTIEIHDEQTKDYWTRVNYETIVPPGKSTLVLPVASLYVGEKARPGRNLILGKITRLVLGVGEQPAAPVFLSNFRLERDIETAEAFFDGLRAFDFGPAGSPSMPGFTRIEPTTTYSKARGYGLKDAAIWRAFDALQPDPLYQDFICIEKGGLAVDLPNGRYHVFVNIDSPSGFWGEYQTYRKRAILAQGQPVVEESLDFAAFNKKYFRFWDTEDLPSDDTFDKYQRSYFQEKQFDVDVTDGQLMLDFRGENFGCSVSAVIVYPAEKGEQGKNFLDYVARKRKFFFDNYFHRVLHKPTGDPLDWGRKPPETIVFTRDYMEDIFYNDTPRKGEIDQTATGFGFAGQYEPLTVAFLPTRALGRVTAKVSDLKGPGTIASKEIAVGYVSNRLTRVSSDGAVYTIAPRLIVPRATVDAPEEISRRFWFTVHAPDDAGPGLYRGEITLTSDRGPVSRVPVEYRVYPGTLDEVDIPVGPFGHTIDTPWDGSDPAAQEWNHTLAERGMRKLREAGFTTFTGLPRVSYLGFKDGNPQLDFSEADRQMALARRCGFTMPVVSYAEFAGLNIYFKDEAAMKAAGFDDYPKFIKVVFDAIQAHAETANWLPVYWNIGDEPVGDDLRRAAENAEAFRAAFPSGPPWFTAPTSFASAKADDPQFRFAKALHVADLNEHSEASVRMLQKAGTNWAFYNGGNRWTYGTYLYKAAKQFDMKFRLTWHWNVVAGDPYYALDCREDDYAWCNTNPAGDLIPSLDFERQMRAGLNDYRYLLTLARLAKEKHDAPAQALIDQRMAAFKLGQREHDDLFPVSDWTDYRRKLAEAIARLR